ncbi:hydroxymyristoyl-ACP dehydratase [Sporanaerobacter sp. PP17-6a]|nr:hydroxymyristoyl-ACP dehydratase [Sporanaerobacter sp. PP17-6a]SCL87877.1 hypothetical protein PP176A_1409 [Sporanaerobacter sp. PP17-6a]
MIIACNENCIYQEEGVCKLNYATFSSGTPLGTCPYFKEKEKGEKNKDGI